MCWALYAAARIIHRASKDPLHSCSPEGRQRSAAEACIPQQRAARIAAVSASRDGRSRSAVADSGLVAGAASSSSVAGFVLWRAQVCEVKERRHQLACALLPVTLLLLADASSLSGERQPFSGSAV